MAEIHAYILVRTELGKSRSVVESIRGFNNGTCPATVDFADSITGPYDVITKVIAPDMNALEEMISEHLPGIAGIKETLTSLVARVPLA